MQWPVGGTPLRGAAGLLGTSETTRQLFVQESLSAIGAVREAPEHENRGAVCHSFCRDQQQERLYLTEHAGFEIDRSLHPDQNPDHDSSARNWTPEYTDQFRDLHFQRCRKSSRARMIVPMKATLRSSTLASTIHAAPFAILRVRSCIAHQRPRVQILVRPAAGNGTALKY